MTSWLNIFKHLLPNAKAWRLTVDRTLRRFFAGLAVLPLNVREFIDDIWADIDPQTTRELSAWEEQFALTSNQLTVQERRDRLSAAWQALGGQSPRYIQDTLRAAGFNVYVHEWWVPASSPPVARVPQDYLDDGTGATPWTMFDGGTDAQDGDALSQDGSTNTPAGYPLVNKILIALSGAVGDGEETAQDGGAAMMDGGDTTSYARKVYPIPADPTKYPYFLYIGGQAFPDTVALPQSRREEFEDLCLKICPTEQWLGILVTYS